MKITTIVSRLMLSACLFSTASVLAAPLKTGDTAPPFAAQNQDGQTVRLADFAGKKIVLLYFYPKDFTGGCTKEACGFRDRWSELQQDNVAVLGVSFDTADSHKKFIAAHQLNFPLLADTDGKITDAYGVRIAGKNLSKRVSFLIGLDGKIVHVTDAGNPETHFTEMKAAIAALNKS